MYPARIIFGFYRDMFDSLPDLINARKLGKISRDFSERIMLAVTEVNGCRYCSYAHSKMALEAGMTDAEISDLLKGVVDGVPEEQLAAICFAQHYAESAANPDPAAVQDLVLRYGETTSRQIFAYIRTITLGNTFGSAYDALLSRFKGQAFSNSTFWNELLVVFGSLIVLPLLFLRFVFFQLIRKKPPALW